MWVDRRTSPEPTGAATAGRVGLVGSLGGASGALATPVPAQPACIAALESGGPTILGTGLGHEDADDGTAKGVG